MARGRSRTVCFVAWGTVTAWGAMTIACSAPPNDYVPEPMPSVDSRPGLVQNGDGTDEWLPEGEACMRYRKALVQSSEALGCSIDWPRCPELVRPAASLACVVYSTPSVLMCETHFERATTCAQVRPGSCLLTAVIDYHDPVCDNPDASRPPADAGDANADGGSQDAGSSTDETDPLDAGALDSGDADANGADDSAAGGSDASGPDAGDSQAQPSDASGGASSDSADSGTDGTVAEAGSGNKGAK